MERNLSKKKVGYGCMTAVILFFCYLLYCCYDAVTINLNGITWKMMQHNESVLKTSKGGVLVGPGVISLWGKYPYIVGRISANGVVGKFIIDMRDQSVSFSSSYNYSDFTGIKFNEPVMFGNLKGQWAEEGKLAELQAKLKGNGND